MNTRKVPSWPVSNNHVDIDIAPSIRVRDVLGHRSGMSDFSTVAYFDPESERSIISFAHEPVDIEELMWKAWDIAVSQR